MMLASLAGVAGIAQMGAAEAGKALTIAFLLLACGAAIWESLRPARAPRAAEPDDELVDAEDEAQGDGRYVGDRRFEDRHF